MVKPYKIKSVHRDEKKKKHLHAIVLESFVKLTGKHYFGVTF